MSCISRPASLRLASRRPEEAIISGMRRIWEVLKIIVEPSGAVPYAAIVADRLPVKGLKVGIVLSGGNLDLDNLPWMKASP